MTKLTKYLFLLLIFQFGVSAYLHFGNNEFSNHNADEKLLELSLENLDTIIIEEREKESLTLLKKDKSWVVKEASDFPVSNSKLKIFDTELLSLKRPYPVGNTLIAAKSLGTSESTFKKKLTLKNGNDTKATLLIGTSPGFKKIHLRVNGEEKTYAVKLGNHNLQTDRQFWLDKDLIKISRSEMSSLILNNISISLTDNKPILEDMPQDQEIVETKVNSFIKDATRLTFSKLVDDPKTFDNYQTELKYDITLQNNKKIEFDIRKNDEEEPKFFLKRSDYPYVFNITKYQVDNLKKYKLTDFLNVKEQAGTDSIK